MSPVKSVRPRSLYVIDALSPEMQAHITEATEFALEFMAAGTSLGQWSTVEARSRKLVKLGLTGSETGEWEAFGGFLRSLFNCDELNKSTDELQQLYPERGSIVVNDVRWIESYGWSLIPLSKELYWVGVVGS